MSEELNPNEEYLLIKFYNYYADEFDIRGFAVMTKQQWDSYQRKVTNQSKWEYHFGPNQEISFCSAKMFLTSFEVFSISYEEVKVFNKHFDRSYARRDELIISYGFFPWLGE